MTSPTAIVPTVWQSALLGSLPGITHGLTQRAPGMGRADGNVAFSAPRDRADAWAMRQQWCAAAGLDAERLVTLGQVHGADAHLATRGHAGWGARPGSGQIGLGDALITNERGPVLMTLHADCQAILFVDPARNGRGPAVAVAHAGWRGTVAGVAGQTVAAMAGAFGTKPADLHVVLGPAIGACCYTVGEEVVAAWDAVAGDDASGAITHANGSVYFSLQDANRQMLSWAGIRDENMEMSSICTRCLGDQWFSHRGQGPMTGRFGAMIAIAGA